MYRYDISSEIPAPSFQESLSFTSLILAHSRKTLYESCKIFVQHALHFAGIQLPTQAWGKGGDFKIWISSERDD